MTAIFGPLDPAFEPGEGMTLGLALLFAGPAMRKRVADRLLGGMTARPIAAIVTRDRRLHAVIAFEGTNEALQIPLDIWLPGRRA